MPQDDDLERSVTRFGDLARRRSPYRPPDMALPRFERERYAVVGRPGEGPGTGMSGTVADTGFADTGFADTGFSVVYLRCEPGKGVGMHAHAAPEVFIPMSGRWAATIEGDGRVELEAWDVIAVPPDAMHALENIGDTPAFVMAINAGTVGAPIRLSPELRREIEAAGGSTRDVEIPGAAASD